MNVWIIKRSTIVSTLLITSVVFYFNLVRLSCTNHSNDGCYETFPIATLPKDEHHNIGVVMNNATSNDAFSERKIQMNPNSTMAKDIINIEHKPSQSQIMIYLENQRRCKQPQLKGRLSGPLLLNISWEKQLQKRDLDGREIEVLTGHYRVPQAGRYYLEIIVLMCQELQYDAWARPICLEDPDYHRVTGDGVFIDVEENSINSHELNQTDTIIGYWYNTMENGSYEPLYTRYQPQDCRGSNRTLSRCKEPMDVSRFDPYQFRFQYKNLSIDSLERKLKGNNHKVCFIGASHARVLVNKAKRLLKRLGIENGFVEMYNNEFARDFQEEGVASIIDKNCTKIVIGTGQWDAGHPYYEPTSFPAYELTLMGMVEMLLEMFGAAGTKIEIFFRSTQ